jgi:hypothetical protein
MPKQGTGIGTTYTYDASKPISSYVSFAASPERQAQIDTFLADYEYPEAKRIEFGQGSYYTERTYSGRFLSAKDIEYAVPGSVAKFYDITTENIFGAGQFLNKLQVEAVQKGVTSGGNAAILASLRSSQNVLGQNPEQAGYLREFLDTGIVPEGLSAQFAIDAFDFALREEGRKQQTKTPGPLPIIGKAITVALAFVPVIGPALSAASAAIQGGLEGGVKGAFIAGVTTYAGGKLGQYLTSAPTAIGGGTGTTIGGGAATGTLTNVNAAIGGVTAARAGTITSVNIATGGVTAARAATSGLSQTLTSAGRIAGAAGTAGTSTISQTVTNVNIATGGVTAARAATSGISQTLSSADINAAIGGVTAARAAPSVSTVLSPPPLTTPLTTPPTTPSTTSTPPPVGGVISTVGKVFKAAAPVLSVAAAGLTVASQVIGLGGGPGAVLAPEPVDDPVPAPTELAVAPAIKAVAKMRRRRRRVQTNLTWGRPTLGDIYRPTLLGGTTRMGVAA